MSSDEEPLSPILEELFEKYKAPSTNVNFTNTYYKLRVVQSQVPFPFHFTTSSPVTIRNESLQYLIRILEESEKPILTSNSRKLLSNEELTAIIGNATKNVDTNLDTIHANFHQPCCHQWTDSYGHYCKSQGRSPQIRGRDIGLEDTICSVCKHERYAYLCCSWIGPVLQKEKKF